MRWIVLLLTLLVLTGARAGYGLIDTPRDTDPLRLAKAFCTARISGDMSPLAPYFAPKLRQVLEAAGDQPIPWQSRDIRPENCSAEVLFGQDKIIGVLVRLTYQAGTERWADTLNFERTPTSWLLNNVFYEPGGNLRFRLFEESGH
jgi:hypothetical protein